MKIAILHYWLTGMRGGEKVLEDICAIYPNADIYTHIYNKEKTSNIINSHTIKTTFINTLPYAKKLYHFYLPLMPIALKFINLKSYDLIISSESGPSKGVNKYNAIHICYCHSPMRYIWDMYDIYYKNSSLLTRAGLKSIRPFLQKWDIKSSQNINSIVSNSYFVSERIKNYWNQKSIVINPGIDFNNFNVSQNKKNQYVIVSQLVPYKNIDLAIKAFNQNKKKLFIIGNGPLFKKYSKMSNDNIVLLGNVTNEERNKFLSESKALIFPGIEDFGIVPLESMASGTPVIAYNKGGVKEYLEDKINGYTFNENTLDSLNECIIKFEKNINRFESMEIRKSISKFSSDNFQSKFKKHIDYIIRLNEN